LDVGLAFFTEMSRTYRIPTDPIPKIPKNRYPEIPVREYRPEIVKSGRDRFA
jgi:hypothetical protein